MLKNHSKNGTARPVTAGTAGSINTNNTEGVWLHKEHRASSKGIQLSLHDFQLVVELKQFLVVKLNKDIFLNL